jgi:hypothetical protein
MRLLITDERHHEKKFGINMQHLKMHTKEKKNFVTNISQITLFWRSDSPRNVILSNAVNITGQ